MHNINDFNNIDNSFDEYSIDLTSKNNGDNDKDLYALLVNLFKRQPPVKLILQGTIDIDRAKSIKSLVTDSKQPITVEIILPDGHINTDAQRMIDEAVSINRRTQRMQPDSITALLPTGSLGTPRKRLRPGGGNVSTAVFGIDTETEQEQQQEQEQQIESSIGLSIQIEQEVEGSEAETKLTSKALDEKEFHNYLREGLFEIPDSYYLSLPQSKELWMKWLGHIEGQNGNRFNNPKILQITKNACEQLLRYRHQFQSGIDGDLRNLPLAAGGFTVVKDNVLDYDPKLVPAGSEKLPLIHNYQPEPPAVLAHDLFKEWLTLAEKAGRGTADNFLKARWKEMSERPYSREAANLFKQYLPLMVTLPVKNLKGIFSLVEEKQNFNAARFKMLLGEMPKLAKADINAQPIKRKLENLFGDYKTARFAQKLAQDCTKKPVKTEATQHLLYRIIQINHGRKADQKRQQHVLSFLEKVSNPVLDALLQVYNEYGIQGLHRLINQLTGWKKQNPERFNALYGALLSKMPSHVPLFQKDYQVAITSILNMAPIEYKWWQTLFNNHCNVVGVDSLPELFKAFTLFRDAIKKLGLKLYQLPLKAFKDIKSLPAALNRMLSILYKTHPNDRQDVWQQIYGLPLNSDGAVRVLDDEKYPCEFAVPAMRLEPDWCNPTGSHYGNSLSNSFQIATESRNSATLECNLYRYIANFSYERSQRYSLNFYTKAVQMIKESSSGGNLLELGPQKQLYALLAGSTINHTTDMSETVALACWKTICEAAKDSKMPGPLKFAKSKVQKELLKQFSEHNNKFPLPALSIILCAIFNSISRFSFLKIGELQSFMDRISALESKINSMEDGDIPFIGEGITVATGMNPNFGLNELEVYFSNVEKVNDSLSYSPENKRLMFQLIPRFKLNTNNIKQVMQQLFSIKGHKTFFQDLTKLTWMTPSLNKDRLNKAALEAFIEDVISKKDTFNNLLQKHYRQYYDEAAWQRVIDADKPEFKPSEALKQKINTAFLVKEQQVKVNTIPQKFS